MGRELHEARILFRVSRHNSEQDIVDNKLVNEVTEKIGDILADPRYEHVVSDWSVPIFSE